MLIAIDHGNYAIKTPHHSFVSGLSEHTVKPPMADEILEYDGRYWTTSGKRLSYMRDKTQDERYFILTLFAIAKELEDTGRYSPVEQIQLAVGLLDRAEYESLKIELAERIDEATAAIEKLNKEKREILDGVSKQQSWVEQFRQYENVTELTRPMVIHLIERINIFEDSNIEIVFRHRNQIEEILQFISGKTADKKLLAMPIREVG